MKFANLITNATGFLASLKLKRDPKLSALDFGMLKVSLMIAALDGKVQPSEIETFKTLSRKCRGYSQKLANEALVSAMRSAGYLILLSQIASSKEVIDAFVDEAMLAMPSGFLNGTLEDVRRAFVMWTAMAIGDGEYSEVEREAIKSLKTSWCEMKTAMMDAAMTQWLAVSPVCPIPVGGMAKPAKKIELVKADFLNRVEAALKKFDEDALASLIANG